MDRPCLKTAHYNIGTLEQYAIVAQLTRASDSYPEGRWFDSNLWYHLNLNTPGFFSISLLAAAGDVGTESAAAKYIKNFF